MLSIINPKENAPENGQAQARRTTKDVTKKEYGMKRQRSFGKTEVASLQYNSQKPREGTYRFTKNKQYYQLLNGNLCQINFNIYKVCVLQMAYLRILCNSQKRLIF